MCVSKIVRKTFGSGICQVGLKAIRKPKKKKKIKTDFLSTKSAKDHKAGIGVFTKQ